MAEWDFIGANTKEYTHCFHTYPATMISHVARNLIQKYGTEGMNLLDPYCGSGTSLVEARLAGMNGFGFDLNHVARKISQVKTINYDLTKLSDAVEQTLSDIADIEMIGIIESIKKSGFESSKVRSWYHDKTIKEISSLLNYFDNCDFEESIDWFLRLTLSDCLREVAFQRNHEFKLYRIKSDERKDLDIPLFPLFSKKLKRNLNGVKSYSNALSENGYLENTSAEISNQNTVLTDSLNNLPEIDIVVTSPPYGDSETTVAYAQFSWLSNVWLGLDVRSPGQLDRELMGGFVSKKIEQTNCLEIDCAIAEIEKINEKRAREVYSFYRDYKLSIKHVSTNIKIGAYACYVVGNRTVQGQFFQNRYFH